VLLSQRREENIYEYASPHLGWQLFLNSFLNYPIDTGAFPINLPAITTAQQEVLVVSGYLLNNPERLELQNYSGNELIYHQAPNGQWKIVLPTVLIN
jgi:hypothetical protein